MFWGNSSALSKLHCHTEIKVQSWLTRRRSRSRRKRRQRITQRKCQLLFLFLKSSLSTSSSCIQAMWYNKMLLPKDIPANPDTGNKSLPTAQLCLETWLLKEQLLEGIFSEYISWSILGRKKITQKTTREKRYKMRFRLDWGRALMNT